MGLSEDQKAMLRLLAQREQGYEDIAALMGLSVEEVRERVKDALAQLEAEKAAAPEPPPPPPPPPPDPTPPPAPPEPAPPQEAAVSPPPQPVPQRPRSSGPPKLSLPSGQGARAAIAAGVAVLVLVVVVLVVGDSGGGDSSTTASSPAGDETASENLGTSAAGEKEVTKAVLESVGGSGGSGVAIFGRVKKSLALQVEAEGLEPTAKGHSYTVWLAQSAQKMLPLASTEVGNDGRIGAQFEVPTEVLAYLANEAFGEIVVTETADSTLKASLNKATSEKKAPQYTGTPVLQGTVTGPIVGAAKRKQQ